MQMLKHIGCKLVNAAPMTLGEYNSLQTWDIPEDQDPNTDGYLVEYLDGGEPNHPSFTGYISWCPKEQFENSNRPTIGMNFGLAIEAAKLGYKIARVGWNGKDMFVVYQKGYPDGIPANANTAKAFGMKEGSMFYCGPYLSMKPANGPIIVGWLASQTDILADDWVIIN